MSIGLQPSLARACLCLLSSMLLLVLACVTKRDRIVRRVPLPSGGEAWLLDSTSFDEVNQSVTLEVRRENRIVNPELLFSVVPHGVDITRFDLEAREAAPGLVAIVDKGCPDAVLSILDFRKERFWIHPFPGDESYLPALDELRRGLEAPDLEWRPKDFPMPCGDAEGEDWSPWWR